jgi:xanthine dehydrogenase accessory factor
MHPYFDKLQELLAEGAPFVAVTLIDAIGSTPQDAGSKMLVTQDGLAFGTVGGGRVEAKAIEQAKALLAAGAPRTLFVNWNLQNDIKMTCGGAVKLFFESFASNPWSIAIFGAGHIAQALVRTLLNLDCRILCCDSRPEWLSRLPDSPRLVTTLADDPAGQVARLPAGAFVLLMTMGHSTDAPILVQALRRGDFVYLGVIGSAAKRAALKKGVLEAGIDPEKFAAVHCPMGLDLGTNHPYEIAISIAAQLIQLRDAPRPATQ